MNRKNSWLLQLRLSFNRKHLSLCNRQWASKYPSWKQEQCFFFFWRQIKVWIQINKFLAPQAPKRDSSSQSGKWEMCLLWSRFSILQLCGQSNYYKCAIRRVFNSGLWTAGPHCFTPLCNIFPGVGDKYKLCIMFLFLAEQILGGGFVGKLLSTDKKWTLSICPLIQVTDYMSSQDLCNMGTVKGRIPVWMRLCLSRW